MGGKQELSVYIGIPFCRRKCAYCDFPTYPHTKEKAGRYIDLMVGDIQKTDQRYFGTRLATLYIGGGTPSLLETEQIEAILDAIAGIFTIDADTEITIEANPDSLTAQKCRAWRKLGINRLSIGVQSFCDDVLRMIDRPHHAEQARSAIRAAQTAGFANISIDLMYGLPGQSAEQWRGSLLEACTSEVQHISCYSLILEENTRLFYEREPLQGLPGEEQLCRMEEETHRILYDHGFFRYEVSNYAMPGYESRHNLRNWECLPYLGYGCAAHSYDGKRRFFVQPSLYQFMHRTGKPPQSMEDGNAVEDRMFERIMLGFRMMHGVDLERFRADYGCLPADIWPQRLRQYEQAGWIRQTARRLFLTEQGMDRMNALLVGMMEEWDPCSGLDN